MTSGVIREAKKLTSSAMQVSKLSKVVDAYPPAFTGNPLNLLFLENAEPIKIAGEYLRNLDRPGLCEDRREYLLGNAADWPFPAYRIKHRPDPLRLSEQLFERFDTAKEVLPTQRDVGRMLAERAKILQPDVVVLMVVDGLSYYDLPDWPDTKPCLVDGATTTEVGYRDVIGKPSVSEHMFSVGYRHQLGFTYFDADTNPLAADLYEVFGSSQVAKIRKFDECLDAIKAQELARAYIQVSAPGLDGLCHKHRDEPPIQTYIDEVVGRFDSLVEQLSKRKLTVMACLTADHGILWRDELEGKWETVGDLQPEDARHVRYVRGSRLRHYLCVRNCLGNAHSLLKVPYITRDLRSNEWGVHGGISAWESIVPLVIRET